MPFLFRRFLLPVVFLLTVICRAQDGGISTQSASASEYPECAVKCIEEAFDGGLCSPANRTCTCTDQTFHQNLTACVRDGCSIYDSLVTQNTSLSTCGVLPRGRGEDLVIVTSILGSLSIVFIAIRFTYKTLVISFDLGLDDWLALATLVSAIASAAIAKFGTVPNGLGKDIWTLTPMQITNFGKFFYIMASLYYLQTTLLKLSFISFYIRIFPSTNTRRLLCGTFGFTATWGLGFVVASIFQCQPMDYYWTKWDGMHTGSCSDANAAGWSNAAMSIALDIWILGIPLWKLRDLQLHWKKKVSVAVMFCIGTFVTIVSVIRLQSLVNLAEATNTTWDFYSLSLWSTIEICVGIICGCLPTVRLLLVKLFPKLSSSTQRSQNYVNYIGNDGSRLRRSNPASSRSHRATVQVSASQQQSDHGDLQVPRNILFQRSFTLQYSDDDEAGLVALTDLGAETQGKRRAA